MATQEEILGDIRKLDVAIAGYQSDLRSSTIDATTRNTTMNLMASTIGLLTVEKQRLLVLEQQGKFSSRISIVLSQSYRYSPTAQFLSTSPLHPFIELRYYTYPDLVESASAGAVGSASASSSASASASAGTDSLLIVFNLPFTPFLRHHTVTSCVAGKF
jgi:hypothetical protein